MPAGDETLLWLYGVVHRQLANQRRGQLRREALASRLTGDSRSSLQSWPDQLPSDLAPLGRALQHVRSQDRELLGLIVWEGLNNRQAAHVLGCSPTVLKLRLHRARRRFAAELAKEGIELDSASGGAPAESPAMDHSSDPHDRDHANLTFGRPARETDADRRT